MQPHKTIRRLMLALIFVASLSLILYSLMKENAFSQDLRPSAAEEEAYDLQWQAVDSLRQKQLNKSALAIVKQIAAEAERKSHSGHYAKALIYRLGLNSVTEENARDTTVKELRAAIDRANAPLRALLQSILAELYWGHYSSNSWLINERSYLPESEQSSFQNWSARRFYLESLQLYRESRQPADQLAAIPAGVYAELMVEGNMERGEHPPSLYELLTLRALNFLLSAEDHAAAHPAPPFVLPTPEAFAPMQDFVEQSFDPRDSTDPRYLRLGLLQEMLTYYRSRDNDAAMVYLDAVRLRYVREISAGFDRDSACLEALHHLQHSHADIEAAAYVASLRAEILNEREEYPKAVAICDSTLNAWPETKGATNCKALLSEIKRKNLSLSVEETTPPGKPFRMQLSYRNLATVHFRLIRVDGRAYLEASMQHGKIDKLLEREAEQEWTVELPGTEDYRQHVVELGAPAPGYGAYILLASDNPQFAQSKGAVARVLIWGTRFCFLSSQMPNGQTEITVLDALRGRPRPDVTAKVVSWGYSRDRRRDVILGSDEYTTDANGVLRCLLNGNHSYFTIELSKGEDHYYSKRLSNYRNRSAHQSQRRTLFFADRAIYRPGQAIHIKGIMTEENVEAPFRRVLSGEDSKIRLLDVNGQEVSSQQVRTNEFGSFHHTFTAPAKLTGALRIENESGGLSIQIEEYKRPRFRVEFMPLEGGYKLDEVIRLEGKAIAFAGAAIANSRLRYTVTRRAAFPYWQWGRRIPFNRSATKLQSGDGHTDAEGNFTLEFHALPDYTIPPADRPVFAYEVEVEVTDVSGETRSKSLTVQVGYTSTLLRIESAEFRNRRDTKPLTIVATNLNGDPVATEGQVLVDRLTPPARLLRPRLWSAPDKFLLDAADFQRDFPRDVYQREDDPTHWDVAKRIAELPFATAADGRDSIRALNNLAPGRYRVTLRSQDPFGQEVEVLRQVTVYDPDEDEALLNSPFVCLALQEEYQPGETAQLLISSALPSARVFVRFSRRDLVLREELLNIDAGQKIVSLPVTEAHRGGLRASVLLVNDYRVYREDIALTVPWTNKQLDISMASFRDRLQPGVAEEWRLTIRGSEAESLMAEMVATLYDASLDDILTQRWPSYSWPLFANVRPSSELQVKALGTATASVYTANWWNRRSDRVSVEFISLNLFGLPRDFRNHSYFSQGYYKTEAMATPRLESVMLRGMNGDLSDEIIEKVEVGNASIGGVVNVEGEELQSAAAESGPGDEAMPPLRLRRNFNETAFFYPQLQTDGNGAIVLKFTMPDALTRWQFRAFAHTPSLATAMIERSLITQKELMVLPNAPRFVREGDQIDFPVKMSNLSDKDLTGHAELELFNPVTMQALNSELGLDASGQSFVCGPGQSAALSWRLNIPEGIDAILYRVSARAEGFSDGEENVLPILPNRIMVTESLPLPVRGEQQRQFRFDKLAESAQSSTLRHHKLTLEMTSNPAWYAVQALPYLMEFPYDCSEQIFARLYANSLARHIIEQKPRIKRVFEQWRERDELQSQLQRNQDLKQLLLEETPWLMEGRNEAERMQRIGLLFDLNAMAQARETAIGELHKRQSNRGGWPWFAGGRDSYFITLHILAGLGHLDHMGVDLADSRVTEMKRRALMYADDTMLMHYRKLRERDDFDSTANHLTHDVILYLYARSFFVTAIVDRNQEAEEAREFWYRQVAQHWTQRPLLTQAMMALAAHRSGKNLTRQEILHSLRERAIHSEEMGMYWKQNNGWYWYQAPIETQAMLIELFDEAAGDAAAVEEMKIWLLKQKQTSDWKTTKATTMACYALLGRGADLLADDELVRIDVAGQTLDPHKLDGSSVQAGTGYFRSSWSGSDVKPSLAEISVTKTTPGIAWGAMYWQYFERLDNIKAHASPLKLNKQIFVKQQDANGTTLKALGGDGALLVGDILTVRIELSVDRDMEYVHMKDMRAAGLEPIEALSGYRYRSGLAYYQSIRDAAMHFFFDWLPKGRYVFEYDLRAFQAGRFHNGISNIQSMYAPEFASHSEGLELEIAPQ